MPLTIFASLVLSFGFLNGLRSLTPVAVLCWGARAGWFSLAHTPFAFLTHPVSLVVFSVLAVGELVGDKLPQTPSRAGLCPLTARTLFAAGCGAALATVAGSRLPLAAVLGAVGAIAGTFAGYAARRALTQPGRLPDLPVALTEDAITIGGALFVVSRF